MSAVTRSLSFVVLISLSFACGGGGGGGGGGGDGLVAQAAVESCMLCHNASSENDYAGPGMENPHPFAGAANIKCSTCHGGDPFGETKQDAHVPRPPDIGDDFNLVDDDQAYFNRLTLTGIDKFEDYEVGGESFSALDYLQFINPGDLRVVQDGRSCGECHQGHVNDVSRSLLATSAGVLSGALYAIGADNAIPANQGLYEDTAADLGFRAVSDGNFSGGSADFGQVGSLIEHPVYSVFGEEEVDSIFRNDLYDAALLNADIEADNQVVTNSPLANLYHEQVAFTCGDCHLGSAGANNRYGDFRSSGCTACHMPYSLDGRYDGQDPHVNKSEPVDPDQIEAPERSHVRSHRILSTAQTVGGEFQPGIDDYACAGCHQGSNRTVMQFWGIRLDQNEDLRRGVQYPANPVDFTDTRDDERLFDPAVNNDTFNGRRDRQYIVFEDYDGDGRDDTPADVHYEAGMGCIDCHGSFDLHGGDVTKNDSDIFSRMEHGTAASCESCHGTISGYAQFVNGTTHDGSIGQVALDGKGNPMPHVERESDGSVWLTSKLTGVRHYVPQTHDVTVDNDITHPLSGDPLYSAKASFAMGRADGDDATGLGPLQAQSIPSGFTHTENMDCASCHASWTNTCMGCHLVGEYDEGDNFSNITGEKIVFREKDADFVYQSPLPFQLGVAPDGKITQLSANTKMFFSWEDRHNDRSDVFAFTDRNGGGNNASSGLASLSHNAMMAHSIRGKVSPKNEGPRYCVACHLTEEGLADYGEAEYQAFREALASGDYASLDYDELQTHIGSNPGNQLNSPLWVHMASGLGSGLFLFDEHGCPINPLDEDNNRAGCEVAPANKTFAPGDAFYDLDRIVDETGKSMGSNNHALIDPAEGSSLRDGASDPNLAGPLGASRLRMLANEDEGLVLDAWLDADGEAGGGAGEVIGEGP